jgi:hypothetical protein
MSRIGMTLVRHAATDLPHLPATGEPELDRLVTALGAPPLSVAADEPWPQPCPVGKAKHHELA